MVALGTRENRSGAMVPLDPQYGVLMPCLAALPSAAGALPVDVTAQAGLALGSVGGAAGGMVAAIGEELPYREIANWTHSLAKTPTDRWMDVVDGAVRGPNHRWLHHHPVDFAKAWWAADTPNLSWLDYARHVALDAITVKGLPILPEAVHVMLLSAGVPASTLFEWTHLNLFDLTAGAFSIAGGGTHLILSLTGHLPWNGAETFIWTFGLGGVDLAVGVATSNPLLIGAGAMECAAGAASLWHHALLPEPSLLENLLPIALKGVGVGTVATAIRLAISWKGLSPAQRILRAGESMTLSTLVSCLSTISPWVAGAPLLGYSACKFAFEMARSHDEDFRSQLMASPVAEALALDRLYRQGGLEAVAQLLAYARERTLPLTNIRLQEVLRALPRLQAV